MNSATSIYAALGVFAFLGHVAHVQNKQIKDVATSGIELAFVAYPGLLSLLDYPHIWSILFFFMLINMGISSAVGCFET